jgi:hypothetical protein
VRATTAFQHSLANLTEDVERYDGLDPFDFFNRWRLGKRIAGEIAILAASRGANQKSLIRALALEENLQVPSVAMVGGIHGAPLTHLKVDPKDDGVVAFTARTHIPEAAPRHTVNEWFAEKIYHSDHHVVTRSDLLFKVRDKEGVAHFDEKLGRGSGYSAFFSEGHPEHCWYRSEIGTIIIRFRDTYLHVLGEAPQVGTKPPKAKGDPHPVLGGVDATLRTMASELLFALNDCQKNEEAHRAASPRRDPPVA